MIFVLDPGHGVETKGKRSPSVPPGILEHEFNLDVARRLKRILCDGGERCVLTRDDEHTMSLGKRKAVAKKLMADGENVIFVSIHANAAGKGGWYEKARGVRIFTQSKKLAYKGSMELAEAMLGAISDESGLKRGIIKDHIIRNGKRVPLGVLSKLKCPAILTECGFMTSKGDCEILASAEGREKIAMGHAKALFGF